MIIQAPNPYSHLPRPYVFLSGSIAMGEAEMWQEEIGKQLPSDATILNPRRDDWDSSWEQRLWDTRFNEQVNWELDALNTADLILVYFDPNTKAPITLLELGYVAGMNRNIVVCCSENFYRRGNVEIFCLRKFIPLVESLKELSAKARTLLRK